MNNGLVLKSADRSIRHGVGLLMACMYFFAVSAKAETYTVTATDDTGSETTTPGKLSWAITQSNSNPGNPIDFNLTTGSAITISGALPIISNSVTIGNTTSITTDGNITVQVTTPGTSTFRVFEINASGQTVNIKNMTVEGGSVTTGSAIYIDAGTLNLTGSTVKGGNVTSGGIYIDAGTLNMTDSTVVDSNASDYGGGIYNTVNGTLTLTNSTVSGNTATSGGGIYNSGTMTITNSTVSGNTAVNGGGIFSNSTATYLLNSIIINNTATTSGGDIYADASNNTYAYYCWYNQTFGTISIQGAAPNQTTAYTTGNLEALADNGGPTYTMAITAGSTPVNTGTLAYYNAVDGYYYLVGSDSVSHKLAAWGTSPTVTPSEKITTDQRGATRSTPAAIGACAAPKVMFTTQPSATTESGVAFAQQPVVTIQDAFGNTITTATNSVTLTLAAGTGALGGTATMDAVAGVADFAGKGLNINLPGTDKVLTATVANLTPVTTDSFAITAGAATKLAINTQPEGGASGAALAIQPIIQIQDANGNVVTTDSATVVTVAIKSGAGGTLGGTLTATASSGVATFSGVTLAGTVLTDYTFEFTSAPLLAAVTSDNVMVTPGTAAKVAFTAQPSASTAAGVAFSAQPVITIQDVNGNTVTTATNSVTLTLTSGTGTLGGTATMNAVAGVADFAGKGLNINLPGADKVLTATSGSLTSAATAPFVITSVSKFHNLTVVNGSGSGNYDYKTTVAITADTPADGKMFDVWTGDTAGVVNVNLATTTVVMPDSDLTVTATYADVPSTPFTLTVNGGTGTGSYAAGTIVNIVANPPMTGMVFDQWTGDIATVAEITAADTSITIPAANVQVTATYVPAPIFRVTFETDGTTGASITGIATQSVAEGAACSPVGALAPQNWTFVKWTLGGIDYSTINPLKVQNVIADMRFTANFSPVSDASMLTVAANPADGGSVSPASPAEVKYGGLANIAATPKDGWHFVNWTSGTGATVSDPLSASTTASLIRDATVTANFATTIATSKLTLLVNNPRGGKVNISGIIELELLQKLTIIATSMPGFYFDCWTSDNASAVFDDPLASTTQVTLLNDSTVTAIFRVLPGNLCSYGREYTLAAASAGLANFAKIPSVEARYTDPVSGATGKKVSQKVWTKIPKNDSVLSVECEWLGKFSLINKREWDKTMTCSQNLIANPSFITGTPTRIWVKGKDSTGLELKEYVDTGIDLQAYTPSITGVFDAIGKETSTAAPTERITIKGELSASFIPTVYLEYPSYDKDGNIRSIKSLRLNVDKKSLIYKDMKGKKSAMDPVTGLSQFTVVMPKKWPKNWDHLIPHNLVISNGISRATAKFQTSE